MWIQRDKGLQARGYQRGNGSCKDMRCHPWKAETRNRANGEVNLQGAFIVAFLVAEGPSIYMFSKAPVKELKKPDTILTKWSDGQTRVAYH